MVSFSLLSSFFDRIKFDDGNKYYLYEDVWTDYAQSTLAMTFFYVAIALAIALIGIGIFVKFKKSEFFATYLKSAATISVTFAVTVIVTMLALGFAKISEKGYTQEEHKLLELIPPLVLGLTIILGTIASYIAGLFSKKAYKITLITSVSAIAAALIATIVCLIVFYSREIANDGYYDSPDYGKLNQLALYLSAAALIVASVVAAFLLDRKNKKPFDSKCIALAGICVALSFALSYIKFLELPQGGSITLASLLPVMLFAYIYGPKKGLFVGMIYGALQAMQDPYIIHPAQFMLDYPVAFAMVGFAGVFAKVKALDKAPQVKFALGAVVAGALRFVSHLLSGVFAFGAYAADYGQNFWAYSAAYNSFVFADLVLVVVVGILLFSSKTFAKRTMLFGERTKPTTPAVEGNLPAGTPAPAVEETATTTESETANTVEETSSEKTDKSEQ